MKHYPHVYLSPHYDDISLSCGGSIHRQIEAGEPVLGVTICAAAPAGENFSAFAQLLHLSWGNPDGVVATRLAEDQASMKILGADSHRLPFLDCIYRGQPETDLWYYNSEPDIFGEIHSDDLPLASEIAAVLVELFPQKSETVIYAPLTVGHHVDHQLTHTAAWKLYQQGYSIVFYEDYPYADPHYPFTHHGAENQYDLAAALAAPRPKKLTPQIRPISEENLKAKLESIRAYGSQLQILFGGEAAMTRHVREYVRYIGEGSPAERIWLPDSQT
jgi:LmbE family N-acetylglucosaminyl deacetylase